MSLDLVAASCLHFDQDAAGTAALVLFDAEATCNSDPDVPAVAAAHP